VRRQNLGSIRATVNEERRFQRGFSEPKSSRRASGASSAIGDVVYEGIQTFLSPLPRRKPTNDDEQTKQQGVLLLFTEMS
jgi:hypothetical protein